MTSSRAPARGYTPLLRPGLVRAPTAQPEPLEGCDPVPFEDEAFGKHTMQSTASLTIASGWMFATEPEISPWWEIDLGESRFIASMIVWLAPLLEGTEVRVVAHAFPTPQGDPGGASFAWQASSDELPIASEGSVVLSVQVGAVARYVRVTIRGSAEAPAVLALRGAEILAAPIFASTLLASYARAFTLFADRPLFCSRTTPGEGRFVVTHLYRDGWLQGRRLAAALARALEREGNNERVFLGLCVHNRAEWIGGELAALLRGYVVVPLSPDDSDERLRGILARCPLDGVLVEGDGGERFARLAASCPSLRIIVICAATPAAPASEGGPARVRFDDLVARDDDAATPAARPRDPGDLFTLLFTSGSTGVPKGAMRSYATFLAMARTYGVAQPSVHLSFQPLSHLSERMYLPAILIHGGLIGFSGGGLHLLSDLRALEPTAVGSVPRLGKPRVIAVPRDM